MEERGVLDSLRKNDKSEVLPLVSSSLKGKPKIEIYVDNSPDALEKERALLAQDFLSQQKVETAISFLYKVLPNLMQGTLATSWESYGIVIGKRGDRISPLDLVEWIVKDPPAGPDKSEEIHTPSKMPSDLAIVAKCLMVYRIGSVPAAHFEYVEKLTDRIAVLYSQQPFELEDSCLSQGLLFVAHWFKNATFRALAACVDMFLVKFRKHPLGKLRVCTKSAMYRGCATIPSIKKIAKAMKMKHSELITYAFDERIVDDMGWVQENWEKEEIDKRDSYFPYLKELQIVPRSPYSVSRNKSLYFWLHCIGCFLGQRRSYDAQLINRNGPFEIMVEAAYVFYYAANNNAWLKQKQQQKKKKQQQPQQQQQQQPQQQQQQQQQQEQQQQQQEQQQFVQAEVMMEALQIKDNFVRVPPSEVLDKLRANNCRLTVKMKKCLSRVVPRFKYGRQDTIGSFVMRYFMSVRKRAASRRRKRETSKQSEG